MHVSLVLKDDCLKLADFLTILRQAKLDAATPQLCKYADGVRWLQELAQQMAHTFQAELEGEKPEQDTMVVKSYNPGDVA